MSGAAVKQLQIAKDLTLPIDAATQTFAFIARKGAGKTYTAGKLVELLVDAGVQVVVLDTVGNWYGLRLAADGTGQGLDIPVLGGLRGDIPLDPAGGALIGDIVVETGRSMVLDASQWSKADRQRFATAFGERLWMRKKAERHPSPVHMVIEESQLIIPQDVRGDTARMFGVFEEIIRLGRNYGIGVSMITQRPQSVNKEVLNMTECLFVGQVNGPQERDALKKWVTHQGGDVKLVDELPGLPIGVFYCWSPQWLQILQKVHILPKRTLDASATPKVGDTRERRDLKPLDLTDLQAKMAVTIEKAKADDPRELKKQIAVLTKDLATAKSGASHSRIIPTTEKPKEIERFILKDGQLARAEALVGKLEKLGEQLQGRGTMLAAQLQAFSLQVRDQAAAIAGAIKLTRPPAPALPRVTIHAAANAQPATRRALEQVARHVAKAPRLVAHGETSDLSPARQRILNALAFLAGIGVAPADKTQLALIVGVSPTSGGYFNNLGALRSSGLIDYPSGGTVVLTATGEALATMDGIPSTTEELHAAIRGKVPPAKWKILEALIPVYPQSMSRDALAEQIGVSPTSGGYFNNLGSLRSLGLVSYPRPAEVAALPVLFLEGR